MSRLTASATLSILLLALTTSPSAAQSGVNITDPEAGSPSGAMYQIPTESGRGDAAPTGSAGGRGGGGGGPEASPTGTGGRAPVHAQDGGFGTSPTVPGATAVTREANTPDRGDRGRSRGEDRPGGARKSGAPGSQAATDRLPAFGQVARTGGSTDGGSSGRSLILLALAAVVAAGLGLAARRSARPIA